MSLSSANDAADVLRRLLEALGRLGVRDVALTGGVAFSTWVTPRYTRDFDLCGVVPEPSVDLILARFDGFRAGPARLPSIIRFAFGGWDVDLFVAATDYDHACLARAVQADVGGTAVRVVSVEDLLIHKVTKLRSDKRKVLQDASDIRQLVDDSASGELDEFYLRKWLPERDAELLLRVPSLDDVELVTQLTAL